MQSPPDYYREQTGLKEILSTREAVCLQHSSCRHRAASAITVLLREGLARSLQAVVLLLVL